MIRRLFWFIAGALVGVWSMLRVQRFARAWTPRGVAHRAVGLGDAVREFADDVRSEMAVQEAGLRESFRRTQGDQAGRRRRPNGRAHARRRDMTETAHTGTARPYQNEQTTPNQDKDTH